MIKRYSVREIEQIFSDNNKYKIWLDIEILVLKYLTLKGVVSKEDYLQMECDLITVPSQIREKEKVSNHDVVAFINHISETTDSRSKKWIHYGLTSSDLVDTGNSVMIKQANRVLFRKIEALLSKLRRLAKVHRHTYCINRDKGFEIDGAIPFGYKFASCYEDIYNTFKDMEKNRRYVECASISGSMGIFSHVEMDLQDFVAKELGLYSADCSTQVVSRDRYYRYFELLNRIVQSIYRLCIELRLLARSEIGEVSEAFHSGQVGSSSMPHKRNPVSLENICGLCRLFGSYCSVTSKNIPIWFERDISHSSVDRVVFVDGISTAIQSIQRFKKVLDGIQIYDQVMRDHIKENQHDVFKNYIIKALYQKHKEDVTWEELEKRLKEIDEKASEEGVSFREMFERSEWGEDSQELFDLSNHLVFFDDFYGRIFCDEEKHGFFDNVFYDEEEIVNAVHSIAIRLNGRYKNRIDAVRMVATRDDSIVFLSRLLPRLDFPIELHTIDISKEETLIEQGRLPDVNNLDISRAYVGGKEVLLVGALFTNANLVNLIEKRISKLGAKSVQVVSLFTKNGEESDLWGLKLPILKGIAGFGVGNESGHFRNCGFVGKLKVNFSA